MTESQLRAEINNLSEQHSAAYRLLHELELSAAYERGYQDCELDCWFNDLLWSPGRPVAWSTRLYIPLISNNSVTT